MYSAYRLVLCPPRKRIRVTSAYDHMMCFSQIDMIFYFLNVGNERKTPDSASPFVGFTGKDTEDP